VEKDKGLDRCAPFWLCTFHAYSKKPTEENASGLSRGLEKLIFFPKKKKKKKPQVLVRVVIWWGRWKGHLSMLSHGFPWDIFVKR